MFNRHDFSITLRSILYGATVATLIVVFQNCAEGLDSQPSSRMGVQSSSSLTASYSPMPATVRTAVTISVSGGQAPYTYAVLQGAGTVSQNQYNAPNSPETAVIHIADSAGHQLNFPISIVNSGMSPSPSPTATPTPTPTPTPLPTVAVYRYNVPRAFRHFYSLSNTEGTVAGYTYEGIGFYVYVSPRAGMHALLRCRHFFGYQRVSSTACGEGYISEATYGHVYDTQVAGTRPLYRRVLIGWADYLVTTDASEGSTFGYVQESILGFVP
jgi:hypothetical protein